MSGRVDKPRHIQSECVSENSRNKISISPCFIPEIHWNYCGNDEAHYRHDVKIVSKKKKNISCYGMEWNWYNWYYLIIHCYNLLFSELISVSFANCIFFKMHYSNKLANIPFLESQNRVTLQIRHIESFAFLFYLRMLTAKQPSNVRKKESSGRIMWICISFAVLVMHSVISCPINCGILQWFAYFLFPISNN